MNPKDAKKYTNLLYLGVPEKERDQIRGMASTEYLDPKHIVFIRLEVDGTENKTFIGNEAQPLRAPKINYCDPAKVWIPTDYLRKIVDNITADSVLLTADTDYPLTLQWSTGSDRWTAMIAHRIEPERD